MADIVDVLKDIAECHELADKALKKQYNDKIDVLEKVAVLFEDHKDPLTAMELRRAAQNLKSYSIINNR